MQTHYATIRGTTPLLQNNPAAMDTGEDKPSKKKKVYIDEEECEKRLYIMEDGTFGVPTLQVRACFIKGAAKFKATKGRGTLKQFVGHIQMDPMELVQLTDSKGKPCKSYVVDKRRVMVNGSGILRARPKFEDWQCTLGIVYDEEVFDATPETIDEVLNAGGSLFGIGDYRPGTDGWFGRFEVVPNGHNPETKKRRVRAK